MAEEAKKPTEKKSTLPPFIERALNSAPKNKEEILVTISNMKDSNTDNAVGFQQIQKVLVAVEKVKSERYTRKQKNQSGSGINTEYDVVVVDDSLSKKLLSISKDMRRLSASDVNNIHEGFLKNKYNDVVLILESNKQFIEDVDNVIKVLSKSVDQKIKNGKYTGGTIMNRLASSLSEENLEAILLAKRKAKEAPAAEKEGSPVVTKEESATETTEKEEVKEVK